VSNADIKLVGSVTDEKALAEIESIMEVFAYEQRIKDCTSHIHTQHLVKEVKMIDKKIGENNKYYPSTQPRILVKGLC
jgi:hypothetical protein